MEWMVLALRRYAEFSGRSQRREFWMFALLSALVYGLAGGLVWLGGGVEVIVGIVYGDAPGATPPDLPVPALAGLAIGSLWFLATAVPSVAVWVRRLHDRNLSGWWYLGFIVLGAVPLLGTGFDLIFLALMCLDGTPGPNRFGQDPKRRVQVDLFG